MTIDREPVALFLSYAHEDECLLKKLETHLGLLKRQGFVSTWHDRLVQPGKDWAHEIDSHLNRASLILLLISADFLASDYCYGIEMQRALELQKAGRARVIPILLRSVDWKAAPFAHLQALPTNAKPITTWSDQDTALVDVATGIRHVVEDLSRLSTSAPRTTLPTIWNIPYPRNSFFLGRDKLLLDLHDQFKVGHATAISQSPQAISGLGGIGKTQIAIEYAYRYHQEYEAVLWVQAESQETLNAAYNAIATVLQLPERETREQETVIQAVKAWLQIHQKWLLVLDNADDLTLLLPLLPPTPGGHLLLTTRAQAMGHLAHRLEVETFPVDQGALFLLRRAGFIALNASLERAKIDDYQSAKAITQALGGLPLALDQAGAYIEETGCGLEDYLRLFQRRQGELLKRRGTLAADHPEAVATTWSLSFEKLDQTEPAATDILRLCSFLNPDTIPEEIISKGASVLGSVFKGIAKDPLLLNDAIRALLTYSLVHRNSNHTLTVHRLVQAVLKQGMNQKMQRLWAKRAILAIQLAFPKVDYTTLQVCQLYLPQAQVCLALIDQWRFAFPEAAYLFMEVGEYLIKKVQYDQAELFLQHALAIREQVLGPEHSDMAHTLHKLGHLYQYQNKYEQAESFFLRDLAVYEQVGGPEHPNVANTLDCLGDLYRDWGKYEEAESFYRRALAINEQAPGPEHSVVAKNLLGLAHLYEKQRKYKEAESFFLRALTINEQVLGSKHLDTADSLHALGHFYQDQDKYKQAESYFLRELALREQAGAKDPNLVNSLDALARLYQAQSKYEEAESFFLRALTINEQILGPEDPNMAHTLHRLAHFYQDQGKYEQAETNHLRELAIRKQALGPEHLLVADSLRCLAGLYHQWGKYEQAEPFFQRALAIHEQGLGSEHPDTAKILDELGHLYQVQKKFEEAEPLFLRALAINEQTLGPEHLEAITILHCLAAFYHQWGKYEKADEFYQRALAINEQVRGTKHIEVARTLHDLAHLYQDQDKYEQAESFYQRSLALSEQALGPKHLEVAKTLHCLAGFYREWNKYEQAESLLQRTLSILEQTLGSKHSSTIRVHRSYTDLRKAKRRRKGIE